MRTFFILFGIILLFGCQPTVPSIAPVPDVGVSSSSSISEDASVSGSASGVAVTDLTVRLEKETVFAEDGTVRTRAFLHLTGAIEKTIDLGNDIQGELKYVDPKSYARFAYPTGDTVAVLTTWWAGQGEEIYITQFHDPHAFTVEHRYGDESGVCSPPGLIVDLPLQGDVSITLEGFGEPTVERSSIDFPCTAP